jgi:protein-S-isoprenylcysteine O-methyltransferase Ste14
MATGTETPRHPEALDRRRLMCGTLLSLLVLVLCLFLPAGTWAWPRGWLFLGVIVPALASIVVYLRRANPDVLPARLNRHDGTKSWDRWVVGTLRLLTPSAVPVAALDDGRFHWSEMPWGASALGYLFLAAGLAGWAWAESVNRFFEPTVRIQTDRGHTVVDTGPYALVRHPGYVAAFPLFLGVPLALGSHWALVPAVLASLTLVVRTALEDRTLRDELSGYKGYVERVRYRLVPGVW